MFVVDVTVVAAVAIPPAAACDGRPVRPRAARLEWRKPLEGSRRAQFQVIDVAGIYGLFRQRRGGRPDGRRALAEGNQLVRSGIYRTALLRYREAAAAGLDTPLLHYNLGVVHYELGDFAESADEFARAAAIRRWRARELQPWAGAASRRQLRGGERGVSRCGECRRSRPAPAREGRGSEPSPRAPRRERRAALARRPEPDTRIGELELAAAARLGKDDNVYRTPAESYTDLSDPTQPLVTPVVHSASFMPAELHAAYVLENEAGDTEFLFRYDMNGAFYDAEFSNATEVDQRLSMGADIVLGEADRRRRAVDTAFFVGTHRETNFDPDDGLARDIVDINGEIVTEDISDRFAYKAAGVQGHFTHTLGRVTWGFDLMFERDEYERTEAVANFDHDSSIRASTSIRLQRCHGAEFRPAPVPDGVRRAARARPDRRVARHEPGAGIRPQRCAARAHRQLGRAVELEADYLRLDAPTGSRLLRLHAGRTARGASGSSRRRASTSRWRPSRAATIIRARSRIHVEAGGARELEEVGIVLEAEYRITPRLALSAELDSLDVTSTDARAAYLRTQAMLGVEWRK